MLAAKGQPQAVETLLAQLRPMVVRYCRARLGSLAGHAQLAEDVAQEVCLAVLTAPGTAGMAMAVAGFILAALYLASAYGLLKLQSWSPLLATIAFALSMRRSAGLSPLTIICCDNMTSNGRKLGRAVADFARRTEPELGSWIEGEVRFPNTMVDSITPASDDALRRLVRERTGFDDTIPVRREAYTEWVIEDVLPAGSPDLASVGATLTSDVAAWEKAKRSR